MNRSFHLKFDCLCYFTFTWQCYPPPERSFGKVFGIEISERKGEGDERQVLDFLQGHHSITVETM